MFRSVWPVGTNTRGSVFFWSVRRQRETAGGHEKIRTGHHIADKKEHLNINSRICLVFYRSYIYRFKRKNMCRGRPRVVTSTVYETLQNVVVLSATEPGSVAVGIS